MTPATALLIVLAGVGAGTINAIVGSGSLITFPTLLVLGYPALGANMANNLGLLPGGLAAAYGYRHQIRPHIALVRRLLPVALVGGLTGASLLLVLPASVFGAVVPALVLLGLVLVVVGPRLQAAVAARSASGAAAHPRRVSLAVFLTSVYGGYFGAAQGIIFVGLLGVLLPVGIIAVNALKNAVVPLVNLVAAVLFVALRSGEIDWGVVALIGIGSGLGGLIGARIGRSLHPTVLRAVIVLVGLVALARMTLLAPGA